MKNRASGCNNLPGLPNTPQMPARFFLLLFFAAAHAVLVNRWSFNSAAGAAPGGTTFNDTISAVPLQARGLGASLDGAGAPGEWTGATGANVPVSETSDGLALLFNRDTNISTQRLGARINGGAPLYLDTTLATTAGTTYHYVATFTDTPGGMNIAWYRNGALAGSGSVAFHLSEIEDVNNWLGRSQWNSLAAANASYDEVRIYDHALSPADIAASFAAGPDASFAPPVLQPDAATLHHLQKVRVAVLANDAPGEIPRLYKWPRRPRTAPRCRMRAGGFFTRTPRARRSR